jgi:hypothetical protein
MNKDSSQELAALMAQCESALGQYSSRTGASMFGDHANKETPKLATKGKPAEQKRADLLTQRESRPVR